MECSNLNLILGFFKKWVKIYLRYWKRKMKQENKKENELKEGEDFYFNEKGLMVLTKNYLLKRGYCCKNNCLNCPYEDSKKKLK